MALTDSHAQTLLCSAYNFNKRIVNYGYANLLNYELLSLVYELLDSNLAIEYEQIRCLENLAAEIEVLDPDICIQFADGGAVFNIGSDTTVINDTNNTAPTVGNSSMTITETEAESFVAITFTTSFTDVDGDGPNTVMIVTLPSAGTLMFNGTAITAGFQFQLTDVASLTYLRPSSSASTQSFTFRISDDNDNPLFSNTAVVTINVMASANQPPTIGDSAILADNRAVTVFTLANFTSGLTPPYNDPEGDLLDAIRIDEVSTANQGVFLYNGATVQTGQIITREDLDAGLFTHEGADTNTIHSDTFSFSARDEGSGIWVQ